MTARTDLFSTTMFRPGAQLAPKKGKQPHIVTLHALGMLHLPSGRLVIHGTYDRFPLVRTGPIGVFPVEASLVTVSSTESRFAAMRIVFSREPVVTWEIADGEFGAARGFEVHLHRCAADSGDAEVHRRSRQSGRVVLRPTEARGQDVAVGVFRT